jgi:phosphoglycolate phosphatase-like HAD superfamily hydrolase
LLCGFGNRKELERAKADVILDEPKDLLQLLI